MASDITPFKGRRATAIEPTRILMRFAKAGRVAEIRERTVASFKAIEFIVYVDGALLESQMFHEARLEAYVPALAERAKQFTDHGWFEQAVTPRPAS